MEGTDKNDKSGSSNPLENAANGSASTMLVRLLMSIVGGAIPLAGGLLSGAASAWAETEQSTFNKVVAALVKQLIRTYLC